LFGHQVGTGLALTHPDGHTERYAFGLDRDVALQLLPRGAYTAAVEAQGIAFPQPIALSKDQDVALKVLTYLDVVAAGILLGTVAAGLLFFGRPWILRLPWSRVAFLGRPAVAVLVLAAGRLGRGRPGA
jgi:hypothetical protein